MNKDTNEQEITLEFNPLIALAVLGIMWCLFKKKS